jgi:hypothetical protein
MARRWDAAESGGRGAGGGCYHLSFRSGSRAGGACAASAYDYITRSGDYDDPERDEALHVESGHMPAWAEDEARAYWDGADLFERANGRLYVSADFALPRRLDADDQVALAQAFAHELTDAEQLPYTLAIHAGADADREEHNPHVHLMVSERQHDGVARDQTAWFRRANRAHPERGGAPKSRTFHGREWMEHARERWAALTNDALARRGRDERVDHRSYARQGVDREPGRHYGPAAALMVARGCSHDRLESVLERVTDRERLGAVDRELEGAADDEGRGGGRSAMSPGTEAPERHRERDRHEPERGPDLFPRR